MMSRHRFSKDLMVTAVLWGAALLLSACGQRGPLYLPERNARVVTHPAASAPTDSAPASSAARANGP